MFTGPQMLGFTDVREGIDKWFSWNSKTGGIVWVRNCATEPTPEPLISCDLRAAAVSHHSQRKNKYRLFPSPGKAGGTQGTGQGLWGAAGGAGSLVGVRSSRQGFLLEVRASPSPPALTSVRFWWGLPARMEEPADTSSSCHSEQPWDFCTHFPSDVSGVETL